MMRPLLLTLLIVGWLSPIAHSTAAPLAEARPNVIIILADDLGYGDLGCYGHPSIRTPELDRMAREGMRFTDFYSAAEVCTPSRAALLTGRYPLRSGMCHDKHRVLRRTSTGHLPLDEFTLPEALKPLGYATAVIGKWHLGVWSNVAQAHPKHHGFDLTFGLPHSNDMDQLPQTPREVHNSPDPDPKWWNSPLFDGEEKLEQPVDQTTLTRRYTERATAFIKEKKDQPFFLYFPHTFPHTPLYASDRFKGKSLAGRYGDVVEEIDWSVGQILQTLRDLKLDQKTYVFFSSDNGPWLIRGEAGGSAGPLRDGKGSTWEGGMRVPGLAWMPGKIPAGTICREIALTMDLFPTVLSLAGGTPPEGRPFDGQNIRPLLLEQKAIERKPFFYYRGATLFAVRQGPWKAHFNTQPGYGPGGITPHDPPLLFHLGKDPGESRNIAAQHPDIVAQLLAAKADQERQMIPAPSQLIETQPSQ